MYLDKSSFIQKEKNIKNIIVSKNSIILSLPVFMLNDLLNNCKVYQDIDLNKDKKNNYDYNFNLFHNYLILYKKLGMDLWKNQSTKIHNVVINFKRISYTNYNIITHSLIILY